MRTVPCRPGPVWPPLEKTEQEESLLWRDHCAVGPHCQPHSLSLSLLPPSGRNHSSFHTCVRSRNHSAARRRGARRRLLLLLLHHGGAAAASARRYPPRPRASGRRRRRRRWSGALLRLVSPNHRTSEPPHRLHFSCSFAFSVSLVPNDCRRSWRRRARMPLLKLVSLGFMDVWINRNSSYVLMDYFLSCLLFYGIFCILPEAGGG